jgi:hypothetical protein
VFTKAPYLPYSKADDSSPHPSYSFNFHFNIIFSNYILVFQGVSFPQAFLPKPYMHFFSSLYATCTANLLLFDFVIRIIFGEEFLEVPHCAVLSSLLLLPLSWQTHISTLLSNTLILYQRPSFTPIKNKIQNYGCEYFNVCILRRQTEGKEMVVWAEFLCQ